MPPKPLDIASETRASPATGISDRPLGDADPMIIDGSPSRCNQGCPVLRVGDSLNLVWGNPLDRDEARLARLRRRTQTRCHTDHVPLITDTDRPRILNLHVLSPRPDHQQTRLTVDDQLPDRIGIRYDDGPVELPVGRIGRSLYHVGYLSELRLQQ